MSLWNLWLPILWIDLTLGKRNFREIVRGEHLGFQIRTEDGNVRNIDSGFPVTYANKNFSTNSPLYVEQKC